MRTLVWVGVLVAGCGSKAAEPTKQAGSGSAVTKIIHDAAPAKPAARKPPPELTKAQRDERKKRMKAGWALQTAKKWAEAVPEFEAALVAVPMDPRALTELGWSAMNAGDFAKARKADEQAIAVAIDKKVKAAGLYNLGLVQEKTGDKAGALRSYLTSIALRPNKTVQDAVAKLGASPETQPVFCAPGAKPCECVIADVFYEAEDMACATTPNATVATFQEVAVKRGELYGTDWTYLLDESNQKVAVLNGTAEHGRHYETVKLDKLELKTIGGKQILWVQTTSKDSATWATDDDGMDTEDLEVTAVTICVVGTPTRCPLRDVPLAQRHETEMISGSGSGATASKTETTVDVTIADDGTATVKLVKGPSDAQLDALVGPHKLW